LARIEDVRVRAGDDVKEGDVLVVLDGRDLAARASEAEQALTASESELALARKERARIESLFAQGVATRRDVDRAVSADQVASAEVQRAQQRLRDTRVGLSNAELRSPGSGRVVDRLAEPGDTAAPGTPLLRIYDPGVLRLEAPVRESLARFLSVGQSLPVYVEAIQESLDGVVEEIVPYAEPGARSFLVKVRLPPQNLLFPGMFGRVEIPAGEGRRVLVPAAGVQRIGQLELVDVATADGRLERRLVTTAESDAEGKLEVLSGLAAGERVLLPEADQPG
jgi:RND family efflux transporter MFP subunit